MDDFLSTGLGSPETHAGAVRRVKRCLSAHSGLVSYKLGSPLGVVNQVSLSSLSDSPPPSSPLPLPSLLPLPCPSRASCRKTHTLGSHSSVPWRLAVTGGSLLGTEQAPVFRSLTMSLRKCCYIVTISIFFFREGNQVQRRSSH